LAFERLCVFFTSRVIWTLLDRSLRFDSMSYREGVQVTSLKSEIVMGCDAIS
jgi:hypothetical protein